MPKVTFTYDLPEERNEHLIHVRAGEMFSAIWEFGQYLRRLQKYDHDYKTTDDLLEALKYEWADRTHHLTEGIE